MPKIDQATKHERKERAFLTLRRYPLGLSVAELTQITGIERRTLDNYLVELEREGKVYKEERSTQWMALPYEQTQLRKFELSPEEAMTLYLAARLFTKQQDKRNEPAETALMKLATALVSDAKIGTEIHQAALELSQRPDDGHYNQIFRTVMQAYIYRRVLRVTYEMAAGQVFETDFSPFLLEPSAIGFTTYAIGHSSIVNARRTYKLERIREATLTRQEYRIPPDFPGLDILRSAWSIMWGETVVVLRFGPAVAKRVMETRWHPSEEKWPDLDNPGYLRWSAQVADTTDMLPWIRGWGADVEVLEPESLKQAIAREARKMAQLYQIVTQDAEKMYYAHSKDGVDKSEWQRLIDHLTRTGDLAFELGRDAGVSDLAQVAGRLHDIGKYSQAFQRRLEGAKRPVDHATAGAREIARLFQTEPQKTFAELLSYCIAGHHSGLPDYGDISDVEGDATLLARREKKKLEDYSAYKTEIDTAALTFQPRLIKPIKDHRNFSVSFLTRMVFSTLVDADWLETEAYMNGGEKPRGEYESIDILSQRFNLFLQRFDNPQNPINQKRTGTLKACLEKSADKQGIFTLTVPTGGGKTLASMAFALNHAARHGLKRIIYVIPFTSIIEQNAAVFKDCLDDRNVLEHHSNFDWEQVKRRATAEAQDDETSKAYEKLKLAAENWDTPIVFTTNVQFFESLFASQKSRCRKLHNIAKSVIIFDEAQMLPREYMKPCMLAVQELVQNYGASAILCTATQPLLKQFLPDMPEFTELAPDPQALFDFYKRVQVKNTGRLPDAELLEQMNAHSQALCIVNTRKHAKGLFDGLSEDGRFHLSTLMCPAHRKETLVTIRERLKNGKTCRVVSTQVMEAGIDVDFPVGYRALAGLDSIIQAAGRVNREGKRPSGEMFVFEPESEFIKRTPTYIKQTADVTRSILRDFSADPTSMQAISAYFKTLITLQDKRVFDAKEILPCFDRSDGFDFKTAAEKFKLIEDNTVAVIIPFNDEATQWVEELRYTLYPASTLRKLQGYSVNIYEHEFQALNAQGVIEMAVDTYAVLKDMSYYDAQTGIVLPARDGGIAIFFD